MNMWLIISRRKVRYATFDEIEKFWLFLSRPRWIFGDRKMSVSQNDIALIEEKINKKRWSKSKSIFFSRQSKMKSICFLLLFFVENSKSNLEPYKWMFHKPYGTDVQLEPLFHSSTCRSSPLECFWLLPNKTRIEFPFSNEKFFFDSNGTLKIFKIHPTDNGIYHFHQKQRGQWLISKSMLNLHGAPFPSIWAEYWPNVRSENSKISIDFLVWISFSVHRRSRGDGW